MSSSDNTVSSRPNSFIKARSLALLIFMRNGLTFSPGVTTTGSPTKSDSMSDRSASSATVGGGGGVSLLGFLPRFAPVLADTSVSASVSGAVASAALGAVAAPVTGAALVDLGGRPGFFLVTNSTSVSAAGVMDLAGDAGLAFLSGMATVRVGVSVNGDVKKPLQRLMAAAEAKIGNSIPRGKMRGRSFGMQSLR